MKRHFLIAGLWALASSFAIAQNMPQQQDPQQSTVPQTQQQPSTPDQDKSATASTGDAQSDIQAALQKDPTLAGSNINVQVSGKTVALSGTVPSKEAKADAEQIAKAHASGMTVKNHLKVAGGNPSPK
jgi:osmotically-inducible protein OsmY